MRWNLLHRLFGWHYVYVQTAGGHYGVHRMGRAADGKRFALVSPHFLIFEDAESVRAFRPLTASEP